MKSIFSLFLVLVFCSFTNTVEAKKKRNKQPPTNVVVVRDSPDLDFINAIPILDPHDAKWGWMDEQIEKDFEKIATIFENTLQSDLVKLRKTASAWVNSFMNCYEIKNGTVLGPSDNIADFLEAIVARYPVPDLIFIYVHHDLVRADFFQTQCSGTPILCSAKAVNTDGKIIHFIDWYYQIGKPGSGWDRMIADIDAIGPQVPWENKIPVLFWRGGPTTPNMRIYMKLEDFPRGILVQKSLDYPTLVDARFTRLIDSNAQKKFPQSPHVSISDHLSYKFQIAMDGETATFPGYQWRLYSGCLTFKQDSDETMWYYGALKPFIHYVPVQRNLEDLVEKVEWAVAHDQKAKEIAENARTFAKENLLPEHMLFYGYKVLTKYASKFKK